MALSSNDLPGHKVECETTKFKHQNHVIYDFVVQQTKQHTKICNITIFPQKSKEKKNQH